MVSGLSFRPLYGLALGTKLVIKFKVRMGYWVDKVACRRMTGIESLY